MVRFKNRYLLVEFHFDSPSEAASALRSLTARSLLTCVKDAVTALHGDYGLASVQNSLNVKYLNVTTRVAIIRCPQAHHKAVWAAISSISTIQRTPCSLTLLHLGGTIRSCQRHLVDYNQRQLRRMVTEAATPLAQRELRSRMELILGTDSVPIPV